MSKIVYSASLDCMDLGVLRDELEQCGAGGCGEIHVSVMDGSFAPGFAHGTRMVSAIKENCKLPCTVHLMAKGPEKHVEDFAAAGCDCLVLPLESTVHMHRALSQVREAGMLSGVSINPATPLTELDFILTLADRLLVLGADPCANGKEPISGVFDKVGILKENISYRDLKTKISVAGAMTAKNAAQLIHKGADIIVLDEIGLVGGGSLGKRLKTYQEEVAAEQKVL